MANTCGRGADMGRLSVRRPGHPLASPVNGRVKTARLVLYEKLDGQPGSCHWCNEPLTWETLCADHVNEIEDDNRPENLVGACRGCNANRGMHRARIIPEPCPVCGQLFNRRSDCRTCSLTCGQRLAKRRPIHIVHGRRSEYVRGCRCPECRTAALEYERTRY